MVDTKKENGKGLLLVRINSSIPGPAVVERTERAQHRLGRTQVTQFPPTQQPNPTRLPAVEFLRALGVVRGCGGAGSFEGV